MSAPLARVVAAGALVVALLGACAVPVAGTARPEPTPTLDGARLEQEVRDYLRSDPATAPLAAASVECPMGAVADPRTVLFCQIVGAGRVRSVPVTVLSEDGDYRIGQPF
ncbi:DUF4333 domain-containing protein [Pseudonocardia pini]|uniref:DUF4333 domain-containing protein n=1 Tax=Pseudonocardia pini TaxID=2758030 RepID=UPI0015F06E2B|nr:DUF4333 domain-containing protein [Pseudonocardia pini]